MDKRPRNALEQGDALLRVRGLRIVTGACINLDLAGGELHCVSGPSGCGKTRLLRGIADLDETPGEIRLDGEARERHAPCDWRRQVMLSPAQPRWWLDNVAQHFAAPMDAEAEKLGLSPARLQAPIDQLSTGEQARAGLLRAVSRSPRVLLLDEPTGALDERSTRAVEQLLLEWLRTDRALLWISHDTAQIERVAHRHWQLSTAGLSPA